VPMADADANHRLGFKQVNNMKCTMHAPRAAPWQGRPVTFKVLHGIGWQAMSSVAHS
jgi:hypothetical protein